MMEFEMCACTVSSPNEAIGGSARASSNIMSVGCTSSRCLRKDLTTEVTDARSGRKPRTEANPGMMVSGYCSLSIWLSLCSSFSISSGICLRLFNRGPFWEVSTSSSLAVLSQIRVRATGDFCAVLVQANIHKIRHGGTKPPPVIPPASNTARRVQARVLRAVMCPCLTPIG